MAGLKASDQNLKNPFLILECRTLSAVANLTRFTALRTVGYRPVLPVSTFKHVLAWEPLTDPASTAEGAKVF